jgi:branched-chain amino acid transport system substrate-binding protein
MICNESANDADVREEQSMKTTLLGAVAGMALAAAMAAPGVAAEKLKVGVTATLEGTYTVLGEDGVRGFQVALKKWGNKAGGRDIEVIIASTDASPDSAIRAVKKLVEQDKVDVVISPLSGSEGIAVKDYAKTQPQMTFINSASGAQETTYVSPAPNFFRFNIDGAQMSKGLGDYIYNVKKYKKIATIGEDYSFVYTQVFGLVLDYCAAGGQVTQRLWVPLGTKDFSSIIAALPDDVDAIYLGLGGGDAVNFLNQYQQAGGKANLVVDQTVLSSKGKAKQALLGVPSSGPQADSSDDPKWQTFVKAYQDAFPPDKRFASPSLLATFYYINTSAAFTVLDQINGDLNDGHKKFREGLSKLALETPVGVIKLDQNRQAIANVFVTETVDDGKGNLVSKLVKTVPDVNQTLGIDPKTFAQIGSPSRTVPECKKY